MEAAFEIEMVNIKSCHCITHLHQYTPHTYIHKLMRKNSNCLFDWTCQVYLNHQVTLRSNHQKLLSICYDYCSNLSPSSCKTRDKLKPAHIYNVTWQASLDFYRHNFETSPSVHWSYSAVSSEQLWKAALVLLIWVQMLWGTLPLHSSTPHSLGTQCWSNSFPRLSFIFNTNTVGKSFCHSKAMFRLLWSRSFSSNGH